MADLSAFSDSSFGVSQWLNAVLAGKPDDPNQLENYLAVTGMKLHTLSQEYSDKIEATMIESISSIPKTLSDISLAEGNLALLDAELNHIASQLNTFDHRNIAGVEELHRLDILKGNMEKCSSTLQQHAQWSLVVREAKQCIEGGARLADASDKLQIMYHSLEVLSSLPGDQERNNTFFSLREQVLSTLRPRVQQDIANNDLSSLQEYFEIFQKLGRVDEVELEYIALRPACLETVWNRFPEVTSKGVKGAPEAVVDWLNGFISRELSHLLKAAEEESKALFTRREGSVGASSSRGSEEATTASLPHRKTSLIVCTLLESALKPLQVLLFEHLTGTNLQSNSPTHPLVLFSTLEQFCSNNVLSVIADCHSMDNILLCVRSFFEAFVMYQEQYVDLEHQHIHHVIMGTIANKIGFSSSSVPSDHWGSSARGHMDSDEEGVDDVLDCISLFGESLLTACDSVYEPCMQTVIRACTYMHGMKVRSVYKVLGSALIAFMKLLLGKLDELRVACGLLSVGAESCDGEHEGGGGNTSRAAGGGSSSSSGVALVGSGGTSSTSGTDEANKLARMLLEEDHPSGKDAVKGVLISAVLRAMQAACRLQKKITQLEGISVNHFSVIYKNCFTQRQESMCRDVHASDASTANPAPAWVFDGTSTSGGTPCASASALLASSIFSQDSSLAADTRSFLSGSTTHEFSPQSSAFHSTYAAMHSVLAASGSLLVDLCTSVPFKIAAGASKEPVWCKILPADATPNISNHFPQSNFSQIGEHLLSLVHELETFASSSAVQDLSCVCGPAFVSRFLPVVMHSWDHVFSQQEVLMKLTRRYNCAEAVVATETTYPAGSADTQDQSIDVKGYIEEDTEAHMLDEDITLQFVNDWLRVITDTVLGRMLAEVFAIPVLTPSGCCQLLVDLEYTSNVNTALGILPHPLLLHVIHLLKRTNLDEHVSFSSFYNAFAAVSTNDNEIRLLDMKLLEAMARGRGEAVLRGDQQVAPGPGTRTPNPTEGAPASAPKD